MIYLITGAPGAGKTLYAVSTLVQSLAKQQMTLDDGTKVDRRVVVDGIPDLLIPHEMMAPILPKQKEDDIRGDGQGVWNWYDWCKPGDVLVIDECQRHWRPRGNGAKIKKEISELETHRHYGIDIVLITQHPMLFDQNARRLVGRHQHVRRLLGMNRAVIYDWDTCSANLSLASSTAKSYFGYPKSAYALYKSSEMHTKQKQKIPLFLIVPALAIVGALFVMPKAYGVLTGSMGGKGINGALPAISQQVAKNETLPAPFPGSPASSPLVPSAGAPLPQTAVLDVSGCVVVKNRCGCFDTKGIKLTVLPGVCEDTAGKGREKPAEFADTPLPSTLTESQLDAYRFAFAAKPQSLRY